ncbi:MAG: inositol monophosphatase family protein, partial [Pseudomonadales bacterium]|nr:inositol monophosphatase family protein [Pseudomonadales bacterium]
TMNFTRQLPHFCVSIACLHNGKIEHGVVVDPIRQEEFVASRGQGATLNGKRIRVSSLENLDGALIATGGRDQYQEGEIEVQRQLGEANSFMRQSGSAALDLAYIAAGRLDGLYLKGLGRWDMAAGVLLVTEAGGLVGDFEGGANFMKKGNIVAGSPRCFKAISSVVRKNL